jgi:hypothetical protein
VRVVAGLVCSREVHCLPYPPANTYARNTPNIFGIRG